MKKIFIIISVLLFNIINISAQCVITKKDGSRVEGNVLEVDNKVVKYRLSDDIDAKVYILRKSEVLMITDEGGNVDVISEMKYKDLKRIYDYRKWNKSSADRYSPALMGLCSFIVPGLGQVVCGEAGRGVGLFVGTVGSAAVAALGANMYTKYTNDHSVNTGYYGVGLYMMMLGAASLLTVDICAIVDARRVAKVKNMYDQAWKKHGCSLELHPDVNYIRIADGYKPTAGLTLALKF